MEGSEKKETEETEAPISPQEQLTEEDLEDVVGGMQNQLNSAQQATHPGGANKSFDLKKTSVPFQCNWFEKSGK